MLHLMGLTTKCRKALRLQSDEAQSIEPQPIESGTGAAATSTELPREWRVPRNLSLDNIIGQVQRGVSTRRSMNHFCEHTAFVSQIEPKIVGEALEDSNWINAMHEELNQFARNEACRLNKLNMAYFFVKQSTVGNY